MALYKAELLHHFIGLQNAVDAAKTEAILSLGNFYVYVRQGSQNAVLYPQFLSDADGIRHYTRTFSPTVQRFIGWLPYFNKQWDLAKDKLVFKAYASRNGLKPPAHSLSADSNLSEFIVKRKTSSFSQQIKGPFRRGDTFAFSPDDGEYLEEFIAGEILKIWYWDGEPVCMERDTMRTVFGDGHNSIRKLVERRLIELKRTNIGQPNNRDALRFDFAPIEQYLAFDAKHLDEILPAGVEQVVDFRYSTTLMLPSFRKIVDLQNSSTINLIGQLRTIGDVTWKGIPEAIRKNTVYTVDAVLDFHGDIRVLEMNSNPFVHPLIYRHLLPTLFSVPVETRELATH